MIRRALLSMSAMAVGLIGPAASAQVEPRSAVHVTVNGIFFLCPDLVRTGVAPTAERLKALGFEGTDSIDTAKVKGDLWFRILDKATLLTVSFEAGAKRCFLDFAGPGYQQIAGVVRDMVQKNGFKRITGGDEGGAKSDVFEGKVPGKTLIARVIIIENYSTPSATISYSERAGS